VVGKFPEDKAFANAIKRSAGRFGAKIIDDIEWTFDAGARRTDSGHVTAQQEVPAATQIDDDYHVMIVADEADEFGEYLPYRTFHARPIAGTQGLIPTNWHRSHEQWGGTQLQRRFKKLAERDMTPRDYAAWAAVRSIGEATTQIKNAEPSAIKAYLLGEKFKLAAFKGVPLTFRDWNGQMRQPILVVAPRMLVTVSPQKEFLHEVSPLDTLGYDRPESGCKVFN
jgi:ABC transporter substrate binding protein (PQQ-dependent alcohol dehydrogenase system)